MIARHRRWLAWALAVLGSAACSTLPQRGSDLPLLAAPCHEAFPTPWEVTATLSLRQADSTEAFLLALAATDLRTEMALLTPQGIPLYRFECAGDAWRIDKQARVDMLVTPVRLLAMLEMMYLEAGQVSSLLRPDWSWQDRGPDRIFEKRDDGTASGPGVRIERLGSDPWYETLRLDDSTSRIRLDIRTLEASRVLPE